MDTRKDETIPTPISAPSAPPKGYAEIKAIIAQAIATTAPGDHPEAILQALRINGVIA